MQFYTRIRIENYTKNRDCRDINHYARSKYVNPSDSASRRSKMLRPSTMTSPSSAKQDRDIPRSGIHPTRSYEERVGLERGIVRVRSVFHALVRKHCLETVYRHRIKCLHLGTALSKASMTYRAGASRTSSVAA